MKMRMITSAIVAAAMLGVPGCRSLNGAPALDLSTDGVQGPGVLMNTEGETLIYNLRAVEPGRLYRASDFNRANVTAANGSAQPAAFKDGQLFTFLQTLKIHHVISLLPPPDYYAEEGYFQFWTKRSGYEITTMSVVVAPDDVYGKDDRSGAHAAGELLSLMHDRDATGDAVLIHGEAGKDAIGIMAAAYELARTSGRVDASAAWTSVVRRYLASNALAPPPPGSPEVTAASLERVRPELMFLSRIF
jgi:hypothetical protein